MAAGVGRGMAMAGDEVLEVGSPSAVGRRRRWSVVWRRNASGQGWVVLAGQ